MVWFQRTKTEVFARGELPVVTPLDLRRAGVYVDGVFYPGFECYGVGIGTDIFFRSYCEGKVQEIKDVVMKSCELMDQDSQAKWTLLSFSIAHNLGYHLSLQYTSDIFPFAKGG